MTSILRILTGSALAFVLYGAMGMTLWWIPVVGLIGTLEGLSYSAGKNDR